MLSGNSSWSCQLLSSEESNVWETWEGITINLLTTTFPAHFMELPNISQDLANRMVIIMALWIITIIFVRYFGRMIKKVEEQSKALSIGERTFKSIDRMLDTMAVILAISITLSILGITGVLYTTLTAFGVIGIMIGIAVSDLTSNLFAGIMLIFNPSFLIGEYIEVEKFAGTVEKVSLRNTILRRSDGVLLILPNKLFITTPIINYSAVEKRRIELGVEIANENDIEEALQVIRNVATEHPQVLTNETVEVVVTDVHDYAVSLTLRFWVKPDDLRNSTSMVLKEITRLFKEKNIELAIPLRKNI